MLDLGRSEGRNLGPILGGWEGPRAWLSTSSLCWSRVPAPGLVLSLAVWALPSGGGFGICRDRCNKPLLGKGAPPVSVCLNLQPSALKPKSFVVVTAPCHFVFSHSCRKFMAGPLLRPFIETLRIRACWSYPCRGLRASSMACRWASLYPSKGSTSLPGLSHIFCKGRGCGWCELLEIEGSRTRGLRASRISFHSVFYAPPYLGGGCGSANVGSGIVNRTPLQQPGLVIYAA